MQDARKELISTVMNVISAGSKKGIKSGDELRGRMDELLKDVKASDWITKDSRFKLMYPNFGEVVGSIYNDQLKKHGSMPK
jgi:hypothetical protein